MSTMPTFTQQLIERYARACRFEKPIDLARIQTCVEMWASNILGKKCKVIFLMNHQEMIHNPPSDFMTYQIPAFYDLQLNNDIRSTHTDSIAEVVYRWIERTMGLETGTHGLARVEALASYAITGINVGQSWYAIFAAFEAGALYIYLRDHALYVLVRPETAHVDERGRLHHESGAAVTWKSSGDHSSGWSKDYFHHGVHVPGWIIENPEMINPKVITAVRDIEVRRVMIDLYGMERYFKNSNYQEVDKCILFGRQYGLYAVDSHDDEPLVMLKVTNATPEPDGSFKDYWLRVPPYIHTALRAVAWTFNLSEDRYLALAFES